MIPTLEPKFFEELFVPRCVKQVEAALLEALADEEDDLLRAVLVLLGQVALVAEHTLGNRNRR